MRSIQEQIVESVRSWFGPKIRAPQIPVAPKAVAASTRHIAAPPAGEQMTVEFAPNVKYNFDFRRDTADFVIAGGNLIILVHGGGEIILEKFGADAQYGLAALFDFAGEAVTALSLLTETPTALDLSHIQPAAGPGPSGPALTLKQQINIWLRTPKNLPTLKLVIWVVAVLLVLILTAVSVFTSNFILETYRPGVVVSTILWAVFFGIAILFFLPPKLVITVISGMLGISAGEIGNGAGLLSKADNAITNMAQQINLITSADSLFVHALLWLFLIVLTVICLPAFFRER